MSTAERRNERFGRVVRHSERPGSRVEAIPRLRHSWSPLTIPSITRELPCGDNSILVFHEGLEGRARREGSLHYFSLPTLSIEGVGSSLEEARQAAAKSVWEEAKILLHTRTYTLDSAQKERKGILMSLIDVVRSKIAKPLGDYAWVLGRIEDGANGERIFRGAGSDGKCFEFAPNLRKELPTDHFLRMGKVLANEVGLPAGPVVELERPLNDNPEATLAEWKRRTGNRQ